MARQAMLLVADEIYYNLHGKAILQGIYSGDIFIPTNPSQAAQLIFFFAAETDISEPFRSLLAEVILPENDPVRTPIPIQWPAVFPPSERTKISVKWPVMIPTPTLRPGKINTRLIHESGELIVAAPWIIQMTPPERAN